MLRLLPISINSAPLQMPENIYGCTHVSLLFLLQFPVHYFSWLENKDFAAIFLDRYFSYKKIKNDSSVIWV